METYFTMQIGYRNRNYPARLQSGEMVNLIVYKLEPGMVQTIKASHQVAEYLHAKGFPSRSLYDPRILRLDTPLSHRLAAVYWYLPGDTIAWEAYTQEHIKVLGETMAKMHILLLGQPQGQLPSAGQYFRELTTRMHVYFSDDGVRSAILSKLGVTPPSNTIWNLYERLFDQLDTEPSQPIHLDFVRGNILFETDTALLTGVLDFEKAAYGSVLYDIARTMAFLVVDCKYKNSDKVKKYFLHSGYAKRGNGVVPRIRMAYNGRSLPVLPLLSNFFLLHDFYKFLRHNPYDSLEQNDHYLRTRAILLDQKYLAQL
jgi:Ser/Thr protein kinase RdoA (MazF antagonist)